MPQLLENKNAIIYGGADPEYLADVWSLPMESGAAWSQVTPGGPTPHRRIQHSMVYNSLDDFYTDYSVHNFSNVAHIGTHN